MTYLGDYSGDFIPGVQARDFSHETLTRLFKAYARMYLAVDGFWYLAVKDRAGNDAALACDIAVWRKHCIYEMRRVTEALNIHGNDVPTLMKALQFVPFVQTTDYRIETGRDSARFTVLQCPVLSALEKEGQGREAQICRIVELGMLQGYADFISPDIKVSCVQAPPRQDKAGVCCIWDFRQLPEEEKNVTRKSQD